MTYSIRGHRGRGARQVLRGMMVGLSLAALSIPAQAKDIVIHAGQLIDGVSATPRQSVSILIRDDRIVAVEDGFPRPAGAQVIDLSHSTVMPGLIECHDHIATSGSKNPFGEMITSNEGDFTVNTVVNARKELLWGFTSVRDLASGMVEAPAVRRAIEKGKIIGPRIWTSLQALGPTGGHSDFENAYRPGVVVPDREEAVVDGVDSAIEQVRMHRRLGASVIKIMVSGGVLSVGNDPNIMSMSEAEIRAVVETAHSLGLKVAAHAHGKKAIETAVLAGVDSIEHGTFADVDTYALMKKHGTFLVPTLLVSDEALRVAKETPDQMAPGVAAKALEITPRAPGNASRAYKAGVRLAFGSDSSASSPTRVKAEEFALLVKAGFDPMDAIRMATGNAAELLGAPQDVGSIRAGRYADIIAVAGDPLSDITEMQRVQFVMKGGEIFKEDGQPVK